MRLLICILIAFGIGFFVVQDCHQRGTSPWWVLGIFTGIFGLVIALFLPMYLMTRKSRLSE